MANSKLVSTKYLLRLRSQEEWEGWHFRAKAHFRASAAVDTSEQNTAGEIPAPMHEFVPSLNSQSQEMQLDTFLFEYLYSRRRT